MMKSPALRALAGIVWVITAIGCIHIGLLALGYNLLGIQFLAGLTKPIEYIFGAAGVISLLLFFMHSATCKCNGSCTC
jgi:uncharacterized membrane protein YuzA (DUF378 family)